MEYRLTGKANYRLRQCQTLLHLQQFPLHHDSGWSYPNPTIKAGQSRQLSCSALHCCGLTLSPACKFWAPQHKKGIEPPKESHEDGEGLKSNLRRGWGHLVCSDLRRGHWGKTSLQTEASLWEEEQGQTLLSSHSVTEVTGLKGMAWSSDRGSLRWILRKCFSPRKRGWALEQAPQGSGQSTNPDRVQDAFEECSQAHGIGLGVSCPGPGDWFWWS